MEYLVKVIGRLVDDKRPSHIEAIKGRATLVYELPESISQVFLFSAEDRKELSQLIEKATLPIIQMQGMLAKNDPGHDDMTKLSTDRKWVPIHMIAYIHAEVTEITGGESPLVAENGKLMTKDGKDVVLQ